MNFWEKISKNKKPFFCLAPMSDVTDIAFRTMISKYSKNRQNKDEIVFWTEFVAADGLCDKHARKKLSHILRFKDGERPIVAQVFGANPDNMKKACQYIASLDFDGIDINMGCPDKSVVAQGAGSALIKNPELASKIIRAAQEGIKNAGKNIPVSVKTRVGFNKEEINDWIGELVKEDIQTLTVHLRTKKEMSKVPANWSHVDKIKKIIKKSKKNILFICNGDIKDMKEAREKITKYGCDGVMIGRGVFGNPWFFDEQKKDISTKEKLDALVEHTKLFEKELGGIKNFDVMKKHYKAYVNGFDGAKELRIKLMEKKNSKEVENAIRSFLKNK